jgi:hypothetical protein
MTDSNDFISGANTRGEEREVQGVIATVNANCVLDADKFSQVLLEITQLLAQNQITFREGVGDREIDLAFYPPVMLTRIYEGHTV